MALTETRTFREGSLRWVEASAVANNTWGTGAAVSTAQSTAAWAARSGVFGYVQAGLASTHTQNYSTILDRGIPAHHKDQGQEPTEVSFTVLFGITADYPSASTGAIGPSALGYGDSTNAHYNFEFRASAPEWHANSGIFFQFHHAVILSTGFTEGEEGDEFNLTIRCLSAVGPTGSGYLS